MQIAERIVRNREEYEQEDKINFVPHLHFRYDTPYILIGFQFEI